MRVRLCLIPELIASYFGLEGWSPLELPEGARYRDLMRVLEKRFEEASDASSRAEGRSIPGSFAILSSGEPITPRLDAPVKPGDEVSVVMVSGG